MNAQRCLEILREIKDVAFATVDENGFPQNRIIDVMIVEDGKLYFCTARGKDFYRQLLDHGQVAITGLNMDYQMVRLNGKAKRLDQHEKWIDRIFAENPSMNAVYPNDSRYILEPFCIDQGQIEFFDLRKEPIAREYYALGSGKPADKGFIISDSCIKCGKCGHCCPQKCIKDFAIDQAHCLHCGLCAEQCPAGAVKRKKV